MMWLTLHKHAWYSPKSVEITYGHRRELEAWLIRDLDIDGLRVVEEIHHIDDVQNDEHS